MTRPVLPDHRPAVIGGAEVIPAVAGEGILPRDVVVWTPPSYRDHPDRRYPVLYAHDGHNLIDPATSYSGVDWAVDEVAVALAAQGRIREFILVGPSCSDDRFAEYGHTPSGRAYLRFLVAELKPMIDARYRTLPGREDTMVMGSSMGGLISFLALRHHAEVFSAAACLSPYLPDELIAEVAADPAWPPHPVRCYLDNGGDELDTSFQPAIDRLRPLLDGNEAVETDWFKDEGAPHHESAWAARVWRPHEFLFGPGA